jgi:Putative phage holin Dp-1
MQFTKKTYDALKSLALVILPAVGTLYFAVAGLWGLPAADKVVGTITAVDAFLGLILKASSSAYQQPTDGKIVIDRSDPAKDTYRLTDIDLEAIDTKGSVTLGVETKKNESAMTS